MNENIKEIIAERIKYHSNKQKYGYFIGNDCIDICASDILEDVKKAGYRKQSETVKEFAEKAEQRFSEDSKWLDIMLKGYDCKDSEDYDAVANAIIRGRFVNRLNDLAEQFGKEE